jgi:hypothetical protein
MTSIAGKDSPLSDTDKLGHQTVDLLPTERIQVMEIQTLLMRKFKAIIGSSRSADEKEKDLGSLEQEAVERYREIGFVAFADMTNIEVDEDDNPYISPEVSITGRLEDSEFDFDRAKDETQHGLADGVEGRINEKGVWLSPKSQF